MSSGFSHNKRGGYIALISAIIISLALTGLAYMVARSGFFARFDSLNAEYKRISKGMAESCANLALLELARNPNIGTANGDGGAIDCQYHITSTGFDANTHEKTVNILALAHYPNENGAYSTMAVSSMVYDPQYSAPSKITVNVYSYGEDAKAAEDFDPFRVGRTEVESGNATVFDAGIYQVTEDEDADYTASYSGDCDSGGHITLGVNDYRTCNIINTIKPQTAKLTVIISSADGTLPDNLVVNGVNHAVSATQTFTIGPGSYLTNMPNDFDIGVDAVSGYNVSDWAGSTDDGDNPLCYGDYDDGTVKLKKGDNIVCAITFAKQTPPPDTVIMLDRTLSMFGDNDPNYNNHPEWITDERNAAKSLLDLYATAPVGNHPRVGVGHFGANGDGWNWPHWDYFASAEMLSEITNSETPAPYGDRLTNTGLYHDITAGTNTGSGGGTNLYAAITKSQQAFSAAGNPHSIVIVSDGNPNHCADNYSCSSGSAKKDAADAAKAAEAAGTEIYAIHFGDTGGQTFLAGLATNSALDHFLNADTSPLSPSQYSQNGTGDTWTNASKAYADDGIGATDTGNHKEKYYNFGFSASTLNGRTINSVTINANAWVAGSAGNAVKAGSSFNDNLAVGTNAWANPANAMTSNDIYATVNLGWDEKSHYLKASGFGFDIPADATITGIVAKIERKASSSSRISDNSVRLVKAGVAVGNDKAVSAAWGTSDKKLSYGTAIDLWGTDWTPAEINATDFGIDFSAKRGNYSGITTASVDYISLTVYYSTAINPACRLGVEVSYDGGSHWSAQQTRIINADTAAAVSFGGAGETWTFASAHSWVPGDFGNSSAGFIVRVQDIDPDPGSNALCTDGVITNLDYLRAQVNYVSANADAAAENADGDHFYISPTSAEMEDIFQIIGEEIMAPSVGELPPALVMVTQANNSSGTAGFEAHDFDLDLEINGSVVDSLQGSEIGEMVELAYEDDYNVLPREVDGYSYSVSPDCNGRDIGYAQTKTCVVVYTADPPPAPAIEIRQNIDIDSWIES